MRRCITLLAFGLQALVLEPSEAQTSVEGVCETVFSRPTYPTRQEFCGVGDRVEDAYAPGIFRSCESMEVDHLVSLRFAHRNGVCDQRELRRLANDPDNLRLTYWRTNRAKGTLSPEEFAVKRLSPEVAETVINDAAALRATFGLPVFEVKPEVRSRWLIEERDSLKRKNAQLINMADALRNEQVFYRGRNMQASEAVSHHASRVSRRITVSSFRNLGAMAAESLPFIGLAAIAGVTALELHDACEALKDVHELDIAFNPSSAPSEDARAVCSLEVPTREELLRSIQKSPNQVWETARGYAPTLPPLNEVEINWGEYFSAIRSSADWIIEHTSATTAVLVKHVGEAFGQWKLPWQ
jgi:hypothetical protein